MNHREEFKLKIWLEKYVAHPFWPERSLVINIDKKSGKNKCQSEQTRERALKTYLEKEGHTLEDYEEFIRHANRQFYRVDNLDEESEIVIPRHQLAGCLVEALRLPAPSAVRGKFKPDSFRHHVQLGDLLTGKTKADGCFDRFVKLEKSTERSHQKNDYIADVMAVGTAFCLPGVKAEELKNILNFSLEWTGVGACRPMGYGRGKVVEIEPME